jgi:hypothetical protein
MVRNAVSVTVKRPSFELPRLRGAKNADFFCYRSTNRGLMDGFLRALPVPDALPLIGIENTSTKAPIMPRRSEPSPFWLFVYPCGTPMDFSFSREVSPERVEYWTAFITVRNSSVSTGQLIHCKQRLGGRVIELQRVLDACCIIVPDSRLWLPSPHTLELIQQESYARSVVFEEWLELCCHRNYILPPSYCRFLLIAEYTRLSSSSPDYLGLIQKSALIPMDEAIPMTSNTHILREGAYSMHPETLFAMNSAVWTEIMNADFTHNPYRLDTRLGTILAIAISMRSPFDRFTERQWTNHNHAELRLLYGASNLFRKIQGFWPSHPIYQYNIRGPGSMLCPGDTIEERRSTWVSQSGVVMNLSGMRAPLLTICYSESPCPKAATHSRMPNRAMNSQISPTCLNNIEEDNGNWILGVLPCVDIQEALPDVQMEIDVEDNNPELDTEMEINPSPETVEEATFFAERDASDAHMAALERTASDIEEELQHSLNLNDELPAPGEISQKPITLTQYTVLYEQGLYRASNLREKQGVAAQILTGYVSESRNSQHYIRSFTEGTILPSDLIYSIDIDSVMASFQATDPWPFLPRDDIQVYVVGPFDKRQIGTSKFRIDPSDQPRSNEQRWEHRVSFCLPNQDRINLRCFEKGSRSPF